MAFLLKVSVDGRHHLPDLLDAAAAFLSLNNHCCLLYLIQKLLAVFNLS